MSLCAELVLHFNLQLEFSSRPQSPQREAFEFQRLESHPQVASVLAEAGSVGVWIPVHKQ